MTALGTATIKPQSRIDLELRRVDFNTYEFLALNSFGQEFIMDALGLRGCGDARMKLFVKGKDQCCETIKMALADGLAVRGVNVDAQEMSI